MKKGTKSLGGFIVVTLSAILIFAAIIAAAFYSEVVIPEPETQAFAAGEEYVHGSNIGRTSSGKDVTTGEQLVNAINNNSNVNLLNDVSIPSGSFGSIAVYSGKIYGNGHKITINVPDSSGKNDRDKQFFGGLMGELKDGGAIYDCTFDIGSGDYKGGKNADTFFGAVAGSIYNATVENVTVNILPGTDFRIYCYGSSQRVGIGMLSGYAGKVTIRNVTINNNGGTYRAGFSDENFETIDTDANPSTVANLVSFYEENTSNTLENIIIKGSTSSTTFNGEFASNLGLLTSGATVSVGNYYNSFRGTFSATYGACAAFARLDGGSATIKTYFEYYDSDSATVSAKGTYNATISEKLSFRTTGVYANMQILFDPSTSNYNNSLVVLYTNQTTPDGVIRLWSLGSNDNGSTFSGTEENGTVIFADLPIADIWNNHDWTAQSGFDDGYFEANLRFTNLTKEDDLTEYEHGYVEGHNSSTTGTALNNANFESELNSSKNSDSGVTKTYYLTSDILVSGFTNRTLSSVNLDGNGYTIYITGTSSSLGGTDIGGLAGLLNDSTIKNLRIVVTESMTINATNAEGSRYSGSKTLGIGILAGRITGNALVENVQVYIPEGITVTGTASNNDCSLGGLAGNMSGRGRVSNCTVQLDGTLYCRRSYPFVAGFVGNTEDPNFTSDGTDTIAFNYNNIIFKGAGYLSGEHTNTGGTEKLYVAAITITDQIGSYNGKWIDIDGFIYAFNDQPVADGVGYSMYGFVTQNHNGDSSLTSASDPKPIKNGDTTYISTSNIFTATSYTAVKNGNDKGNTYWDIPTTAAISGSVTGLDGSTVTPYFPISYKEDGTVNTDNLVLVASGTGVSGFNGVLKEKGATIGEGKDSIPAAAKDDDNLVLEMPKADVVSASDTSVGLEEAKTVTLTTGINKSFTYNGSKQARDVYLKYGESSISYTATYAAESGSELSNGSPINAGNYYISVVALTGNAGDYYFFDTASNTLSKSYTYASVDENSNKFVIEPAVVDLAFDRDSMTVTYDAIAVEKPEVSVSGGTFGLDDLGELTYVWMKADGTELSENPTDAGRYKVKISAVANPNFTVGGAAAKGNDFTIKAKEVTLSVEEGGTSFTFAQDKGALTDVNYDEIGSYRFSVTGFVEEDDVNSGYTVSITEGDPSFITENTTDGTPGTSYLSKGVYIATVVLSSENYTFGEGKNTFTVTVNENSSANKWLTEPESIISDLTYYSEPDIPTDNELPVPRFGNASVAYRNAGNSEVTPSKTLDVGTYTATVTVSDSDSDSPSFNSLEKSYSFKVKPLTLTSVTLSGSNTTYDTAAYEESNISIALRADNAEYNSDEDIENLLGTVTWEYQANESDEWSDVLPTKAAKYTFRIKSYTNSSNVALPSDYQSGTFTISPKEINFVADLAESAQLVYGTEPENKNALVDVELEPTVEEVYVNDFTDWSYEVALLLADGGAYSKETEAEISVSLTVTVTINDKNYSLGTVSGSETLTLEVQKATIGDITIATEFTTEREEEGDLATPGFVYGAVTAPLTFNGIPKDVKPTIVYTKDGANIGEFTDAAEAGDYTVKVTISDKNYNVKEVSFKFFIDKAEQKVDVSIGGWTYGDIIDIADKLVIDGIKEGVTPTVSYSGTTNAGTVYDTPKTVPTQAGNYNVHVSWDATDNYKAGSAAPAKFTIARAKGKADITITYSVDDVTDATYTPGETKLYYNGSAYTFKVAVEYFEKDGGTLTTEINDNPGDNLTTANAGTYTVTATVSESSNYLMASSETSIVINKAVISGVSVGTSSFVFGVDGGLTTDNANDGTTYGTADVTFVEGKGGGTPAFTYSLSYNSTESDKDGITYISAGTYTLTMKLTDETDGNFVFDGNTSTTAVTVQVTQGKNIWTDKSEIKDFTFGFAGTRVIGTAKFGTAEVTYYTVDVNGQADKEKAIEFSFAAQGASAGTYAAVVSVPGNGNYEGISYEYTFVVNKHRLNITDLEISGTKVSGSAADGYTVTYAPDMVLSATVTVSSGEDGLSASLDGLIGEKVSHTYFFEYSADAADPKVWKDGLPKDAGTYTVRFKGMKLAAKYDINNFAFVYEGNARELTTKLKINKATVSASAELKEDIVYGMTAKKIKELVSVSEGVSMKDVTVTYVNESNESVGYSETTPSGTKLTITVMVEAEDDNYTVDSDTVKLEETVQKAKLTVTAEDGSEHSATFVPENFNAFDQVTAKWGENPVEASVYLSAELTGYSGEVAGDPETNFWNREIGVYTFTVKLKDDNFLMVDVAGAEYEGELTFTYTLATETVTLTVKLEGWTYGDAPKNPTFTVTDADGNSIGMQTIGQYISVKYEGINGTVYDFATPPTEAGDYIITAAITGHTDYVAEEEATKEFTIGKRPIALVLSSDSDSDYYDRRRVAITDFTSVFGEYFLVADGYSYAGGHALKNVFTLTASSDSVDVTEIKNAGSYKITAELINDNYVWATGATSPEFTYTIVKAIVEGFKVEIENWIYGEPGSVPKFSGLIDDMTTGEGYEVTYSYSGEDNSGKVYNSSSKQPTDAGKYTVTATYPGNANYESATATYDFVIGRADLDEFLVSAPDNLAYTGQPLSDEIPVVEGTRGDYTVVYKNSDGEVIERSAIIAAGTYTAIVTALETANYNKAEKQCQIIIAPARVSVTVSSSNEISFGVLKTDQVNGVYDTDGLKGYDFGVNITSQTSLSESADPLYYTYVIVSSLGGEVAGEEGFINVGSYKVVIELSSDNYIFTDTDEHTTDFAFEILTVENTITSDFRKDWTYGNNPSGVTADAKYGSVVIKTVDKYGNEVVVSNALHAGTYTDIFTVPASEYGNYGEITVTEEFTISPRPLSWNWSDEIGNEIVFGTTSEELDGKVATEISGWFNGDSEYASVAFTFTVDGAAYDELVNAGSEVTLKLSFEWAEGAPEKLKGSYSVTDPERDEKSFEVISKSVTLTKEDFNEVYGSAYDPSTPLADYFANRFFYEDTAIGEAFDEYTVCEYSINGDGKAEDRLNAGTYTVTVSVSGNYSAEAELTYTVDKKTISLSDEASVTEEYGVLTPGNLTSVIDPAKLFEGLEFEDKFSEGDFTTSVSDYSENVEDGFLTVGQYFVDVALTDKAVNYTAPKEGLGSVVIYVTKAGNYIDSYYPDDWTYLDNLTEYLPEIPGAKFGKVQSAFFAPDGTEMDLNDFSAETPAGTYSYEFTVSGTDNYASATLKGVFSVKVRNVFVTLNAPDTIFDGAAYDQLTYTLSDDKVTEYVGEIAFGYSSGGSSYTEGFPVNAGSYIIKLLNYSDSENINLLSEPISVVISPAPMNFTVTGAAYASVEYGTDPDEIDLDALIASVVPDSDVGSFTYTVNLLTAKGREYTDSTYAGTVLYACVEITVTNGNFYAVVPEEVEDFPAVNVARKAHDISLEIDDEIVTDGNEITVAEGIDVNLIDAIASYMSKNGVKYYDYVVTVDGESYNRDMVWTPGEHEVIVRLSGNHEGEASFTVMVEESLEPAKEPFVPATKVGEVLESINFTWASAVSIGFGVAVAVLIILFFGLRRSKKK